MHVAAISLILVYFIIVVIVLTLLWRISLALDKIGERLDTISRTLASRPTDKTEK